MTITLSAETQKLLEERMRERGFENPEDALREALQDSHDADVDRSPETLAAIRRGLAQSKAGQTRPWSEFEKELVDRYSQK
jgi:predicted transcriptional regulator